MMSDIVAVYVKGKGNSKRSVFADHLISQGVEVKEVESTGEIRGLRGMKCDYIIVDEWVKDNNEKSN